MEPTMQFALLSADTLRTIPGAIRKDGTLSSRWLTRADKLWAKTVGSRAAGVSPGKRGTSNADGVYLYASERDYYGNGASDRMRADFFEALRAA
jgi:hypothetical protein